MSARNDEDRPLWRDENGRFKWKYVFQMFTLLTAMGALSAGIYASVKPQQGGLTIVHFSDFYQLQGIVDPTTGTTKGGISRLVTFLKQKRDEGDTVLVFGGDLFGPSAMSTFFGGPKQMVETFNLLELDVAVAGNHEFDKGAEFASTQFTLFNFPWLLANFHDNTSGTNNPNLPLISGTNATHIVSSGGINIAFIGLGFDYRDTTSMGSGYVYTDFIESCQAEVKVLKAGDVHIDLYVALTHMTLEDGQSLLKAVPEIQLLLTGHNHIWYYERINGVPLVEGDINAEKVSVIDLSWVGSTQPLIHEFQISFVDMDSSVPEDPDMAALVQKYVDEFTKAGEKVIGSSLVSLTADAATIRSSETNVGNFVTDAQRNWTIAFLESSPGFSNRTDKASPVVSITNSGGLRWNYNKPAGDITDGQVFELLPFGTVLNIVSVKGSVLRAALENSVSLYPSPAGKFLQISGFRFTFACSPIGCTQPAGSRILTFTLPDNTPIGDDDTLFLGLPDFVLEGGDGYTMFGGTGSEVIVGGDSGLDQFTLVEQAIVDWQVISPAVDGRISGIAA